MTRNRKRSETLNISIKKEETSSTWRQQSNEGLVAAAHQPFPRKSTKTPVNVQNFLSLPNNFETARANAINILKNARRKRGGRNSTRRERKQKTRTEQHISQMHTVIKSEMEEDSGHVQAQNRLLENSGHEHSFGLEPFSRFIHDEIMAEQGYSGFTFDDSAIAEMRDAAEDHVEFLFAEAKVIADHNNRPRLQIQDLKWAQEYRIQEQRVREAKPNVEAEIKVEDMSG